MNYSLEDIYGSGIMNPNKVPSTDINDQIQQYMDSQGIKPGDAILTPDVVSTDTPVATSQPSTSTPNTSVPPVANAPEEVKVKEGRTDAASVSQSTSGLNFDTLSQVQKNDKVGERVAARMAPIDAEYNAQAEEQARISGDQARIAQGVTDIEKQKAELDSQFKVDQSRLIDDHNNAVAGAEERGRQRVQAAIDTHQRMLQDYMTTQVDPGMMWKNMTGGEKAGSGLAVFASAFLGAKGIDTPVMTMLDKALDRNIDAQLQNINIKGRALDEQGKMVQMVREQSASDLEAKLRLKDMALESGKYAIAAQMSQFGSKLAELKGQEVISNIEQNQLKFRQDLVKERTQQEQNITGQEISRYGAELSASVQRQANAISARRVALDEKQYADSRVDNTSKAIQELAGEAVWDTTAGVDNKGWLFKPGLDKSEKVDVRKKLDANSALLDILKAAADLSAEIGPRYNGLGKDYWNDADKARHDQLITSALKTMQKEGSGLSSTDNEYKQYEKMLQPDTLLNKQKFGQLAGQLIQIRKNSTESALSTYTIEMPETTRQALISGGFAPSKFSHDNIGKNVAGSKDGYAAPLGTLASGLVDNKEEVISENKKYFDTLQSDKANKEEAKLTEPEAEIVARYYETDPDTVAATYNSRTVRNSKNISLGKKQIINLAKNANAGDKEAISYLNQIANEKSGLRGEYGGVTENAKFAQFVLRDFDLPGAVKSVAGQSYSPDYLQQRLEAGDYQYRGQSTNVAHDDTFVKNRK